MAVGRERIQASWGILVALHLPCERMLDLAPPTGQNEGLLRQHRCARRTRPGALPRQRFSGERNPAGVRLNNGCPSNTPRRTSRQESPGDPAVPELRAIDGPGRNPNRLLPVSPLRRMLAHLERAQTRQGGCRHLRHTPCGPVGRDVSVGPPRPSVLLTRQTSENVAGRAE
jgi:hypothetical protein